MAADLKDPANSVKTARKTKAITGEGLGSLIGNFPIKVPLDSRVNGAVATVLVTKAEAYAMILKGLGP